MEQHKLIELVHMYVQLKSVYEPSEKIKQSLDKLENHIHLSLMSLKTTRIAE